MILRTLHLTNAWHASSGGIGTFYRALLAGAHENWHVRLVVPGAESRYEAVNEFAGIHHVQAPSAPFSPAYRVLYPSSFLWPGTPLREILRREQPHVVEVNDKYTLVYLGGLLRINAIPEMLYRPTVVGISCERMDETLAAYMRRGCISRAFAWAYMKFIHFEQADHHIAVSQHVAQELESASYGHKVTRGVWIRGMGVDSQCFHPGRKSAEGRHAIVERCGLEDPVALLLYAGRLAPEKNLALLLDTLELLRNERVQLAISGDGPAREEFLREAQQRCPGLVTYLGHERDRIRLATLFANADAFLHPNAREPFGIAPLEAMAAGVPLIAPASGGVIEYANRSNAWVTEATPQAFADAVRSILRDPADRERRVRAALTTARERSWPAISQSFYKLYRHLHALRSGEERIHRNVRESAAPLQPAFWSN